MQRVAGETRIGVVQRRQAPRKPDTRATRRRHADTLPRGDVDQAWLASKQGARLVIPYRTCLSRVTVRPKLGRLRAVQPRPTDAEFYLGYVDICPCAGVEANSGQRVREFANKWNACLRRVYSLTTQSPAVARPRLSFAKSSTRALLFAVTPACTPARLRHAGGAVSRGCSSAE